MIDFAAELQRVFVEFVQQAIAVAPAIAVGVIVGLVGIVSAWLIERLVIVVMRRKSISKLMERVGFAEWLVEAGIKRSPARLMGSIAFWVVLLLLVRTAAYVFNLVPISEAIGTFLGYLPSLFAAVVIVLVGSLLARGAAAVVRQGTEGAGSDVAGSVAAVVYGLVMYAIGIMALTQLGIDTQVIRVFSVIVLSSVGLAFSLAFGLGARTAFESVIAGYHVRRSFGVGDTLELPEGTGTIERVTASQTFIRLEGRDLVLSNSELLSRTKFRAIG